jgi:hypothetical protein
MPAQTFTFAQMTMVRTERCWLVIACASSVAMRRSGQTRSAVEMGGELTGRIDAGAEQVLAVR